MLLDPNTLSKDGTVAVASWTMSEDGCYMAYQLSRLAAFFSVLECYAATLPIPDGSFPPPLLLQRQTRAWNSLDEGMHHQRY